MPYAGAGRISTAEFEGSVPITVEQYKEALDGMLVGKLVSIENGFTVFTPEPAPEPPIVELEPDPKLIGVEFGGVMCSATAEDQHGLTAVLVAIQLQGQQFKPTLFYFANGNKLVINLKNYMEFAAVWLPFRQSFFTP